MECNNQFTTTSILLKKLNVTRIVRFASLSNDILKGKILIYYQV